MKCCRFQVVSNRDAFFRSDVLLLGLGVFLLVSLFCAAQQENRQRSLATQCTFNIRFMSLALRLFSNDNRETFPMRLSASEGGSRQAGDTGEAFKHFAALRKQIMPSDLTRLACPADANRIPCSDFSQLSNAQLSYWVGLDADETHPAMFLLGDRNLTNGIAPLHHVVALGAEPPVGWTEGLHHRQGNVGLVDGSVTTTTDAGLTEKLAKANRSAPRRLTRVQLPDLGKP